MCVCVWEGGGGGGGTWGAGGGGADGVVLRNTFRIIQNQSTLHVQGQNTVHLITSNVSLLSWCNLLTYILSS